MKDSVVVSPNFRASQEVASRIAAELAALEAYKVALRESRAAFRAYSHLCCNGGSVEACDKADGLRNQANHQAELARQALDRVLLAEDSVNAVSLGG